MNNNMDQHDTGHAELNLLVGAFTIIFTILGISLNQLDLFLSVLFKFLSCVSVIIIIIINWDKGIQIIKNKFKKK